MQFKSDRCKDQTKTYTQHEKESTTTKRELPSSKMKHEKNLNDQHICIENVVEKKIFFL